MKNRLLILIALLVVGTSTQTLASNPEALGGCQEIIEAFEDNDTKTAFVLVDRQSSNCTSPGDGSPLIAAVKSGNLSAVSRLVESFGADPNLEVPGDGNPLIQAAGRGYEKITRYLIKAGADVNGFVQEDETPLINAAANGHLKIVRILVENGADVNKAAWSESVREKELRSPLSMATRNGRKKVVQYLIEQGAQ